ncbi:hypothetical protein L0U85_05370 [Glycomyces sp. L485]|uniref:hypothetical protein n=1 Tax=Glycomyces sp. L485 TaxID=2909235 RepID=UPI001F4B8000|nr:hypothetical protein [Glycomyces sp. L485]MCH7230287.1 hypothetical protein [Glycomyces sp. L485]
MSFEEKLTWLWAAILTATPIAYYATVLPQTGNGTITDTPYRAPMIISIAAATLAFGIGYTATRLLTDPRSDERDADIDRKGQVAGSSWIALGATTALTLALLDIDQFWIANALYLAFAISGIAFSAAKITGYRGGARS